MSSTTLVLMGAFLPMFAGCAGGHGAAECPEARQPVAPVASAPALVNVQSVPGAASSAPPAAASAPATVPAPAAATTAATGSEATQAPTPAASGPALPELKLHLSGMHIGGGPNDEATKRPFIKAIEGAFDAMRTCYKKSEDPARGGTFGVDLKIAGKGGRPELQQVRTVLKGDGLKECLETAFKGIEFGPPPKGPTIVSVSVKFSLGS